MECLKAVHSPSSSFPRVNPAAFLSARGRSSGLLGLLQAPCILSSAAVFCLLSQMEPTLKDSGCFLILFAGIHGGLSRVRASLSTLTLSVLMFQVWLCSTQSTQLAYPASLSFTLPCLLNKCLWGSSHITSKTKFLPLGS